ncbi:hypothetical protein T01_10378 [Trichinella spiralis]|uniref:Uncharacterized protein n=1 Tax=Trichinella spiralis TaxID=6334 RepID=A0A0V1B488_TRISP|nr:hypothetical protein T01_10378 [Trichinella spiralis]
MQTWIMRNTHEATAVFEHDSMLNERYEQLAGGIENLANGKFLMLAADMQRNEMWRTNVAFT